MSTKKIDASQWENDIPTYREIMDERKLHEIDPNQYNPWKFFLTYKGENKNGKK